MIRYCYIVAEGPQDIEFLICLLKCYGLSRVRLLPKLDSFWKPLIPTKFPIDNDLMKRVPVPVFLQNSELSVALHSAIGLKRLVQTIEETLALIPISQVFGIGLFLDADEAQSPQTRFHELISRLPPLGLSPPSRLGEVVNDSPRCGIFIAPNNCDLGTLEDMLLDCAEVNYPNLLDLADNYVSSIDLDQLSQNDLRDFRKPAGRKKAIVSSISSILRPGKTLQVSIQDNHWIDQRTMVVDSVKLVRSFLDEVTGMASPC